jgi:DnaJ-class molecular chaperone
MMMDWISAFVLLSMLISAWAGADYYKILGITKKATSKDIKKAYRKLSLKYHPDKNPSPDAANKFAKISTAYSTLSDPDKRKTYDRGGAEAVERQEQQENSGGGGAMDPFSMFESFGFGGGFGGRRRQEDPRTDDVNVPLEVTLAQLYIGELLDVSYSRQVLCVEASSCEKKNQNCQGPGVSVRVQQLAPGFVQQVQVNDPSCVARGKAWKTNCKACPNGMTEEETIELTVDLRKGMAPGDTIKFEQVADERVGHIAGDLIFTVRQAQHGSFARDGDNLMTTMPITLLDSLVGFEYSIDHLDGHQVPVTKTDVSYCSEIIRIAGQGMPKKNGKGFGDLFVTLSINFPKSFSESQKAQLKEVLK